MTDVIQALFSGLSSGGLFAILGVGIVVIYRVTGLPNFTQGVFAIFAGFLMSSLLGALGLPWLLAFALTAIASAVLGALVGAVILVRRPRDDLSAVVILLGLSILFEGLFVLGWGTVPVSYRSVVHGNLRIAGGVVTYDQLAVVVVCALAVVALQLFFARSYLGKAMTACHLSPTAARLVGIGLPAMGVLAFAVSGLLSGVAGSFATAASPVDYGGDVLLTINAFAAATFAGLTSPVRALVGGLVLGELEAFVAISSFGQYQVVVALVGMVVALLARGAGPTRPPLVRRLGVKREAS